MYDEWVMSGMATHLLDAHVRHLSERLLRVLCIRLALRVLSYRARLGALPCRKRRVESGLDYLAKDAAERDGDGERGGDKQVVAAPLLVEVNEDGARGDHA